MSKKEKKEELVDAVAGKTTAIIKHDESHPRGVLDKMRKSELVDLVIDTEKQLHDALDVVALRDVKIGGLEFRIKNLVKECADFKISASDANSKITEVQQSLDKAIGELNQARQMQDASKLLVDELTTQLNLAKTVSERQIDELKQEIATLKNEAAEIDKRPFWKRFFGK